MQRQMLIFRDELEATKFWEGLKIPEEYQRDSVQKELTDYYWLMQSVGTVYFELTEGVITKQATKPEEVIRVVNEITARKVCEAEEKVQGEYDQLEEEWEEVVKGIHVQLRTCLLEIERLKEGDFTPEEFQELCHNLHDTERDGIGPKTFAEGCIQYQEKLFGKSPLMFKGDRKTIYEWELLQHFEDQSTYQLNFYFMIYDTPYKERNVTEIKLVEVFKNEKNGNVYVKILGDYSGANAYIERRPIPIRNLANHVYFTYIPLPYFS